MKLLYYLTTITMAFSQKNHGCVSDKKEDRILSNPIAFNDMTPDFCRKHCSGKKFYGTQWGIECWCGDSEQLFDYKLHGNGVCNMPCGGDRDLICGGYNSITLYENESDTNNNKDTKSEKLDEEFETEFYIQEGENIDDEPVIIDSSIYNQKFSGEGTYYGETSHGNCALEEKLPDMYNEMTPVAIGNYGDSSMCGSCVKGTSENHPNFKGFVSDKCPECGTDDLDLSMDGDGRFPIDWEFVPCPGSKPTFIFEGSNEYYWKIQPRGTSTPVVSLFVSGKCGKRTDDNFFIVEEGPFIGPQLVTVITMDGKEYTESVTLE